MSVHKVTAQPPEQFASAADPDPDSSQPIIIRIYMAPIKGQEVMHSLREEH